MLHEGQRGVVRRDVGRGEQVSQGVRGHVAHHHAVTGVAPRARESALVVNEHRGGLITGHGERSAPTVGDTPFEVGKELAQRRLEEREDLRVLIESRLDGRAKVIRRAAAAKGDAIIAGSLSVDNQVTIVGEGLVVAKSRLVPEAAALGLARDHEREERRHAASFTGQGRRKPLGRAHDETGVHASPGRRDLGGGRALGSHHPGHPRVLVDLHPEALIYLRQTSHQAGRVKARAVRGVRRPESAGDPSALARLALLEPHEILERVAQLSRVAHALLESTRLKLAAREVEGAPLDEVGVDAVAGEGLAQGSHPLLELSAESIERGAAVARDDRLVAERIEGRGPATVAARRAKAADFLLENDDPQRGITTFQLPRGPQPGETAADDGHVHVEMATQRRPRRDGELEARPPQRRRRLH